jgi:hypothetical protein
MAAARAPGEETPLHWAASSDDADVAAALIDGGADLETPDGSVGSPLDNAIGYCCWHVAALLVARGARVDKLWHAGALGLLDRVRQLLDTTNPTAELAQRAGAAGGALSVIPIRAAHPYSYRDRYRDTQPGRTPPRWQTPRSDGVRSEGLEPPTF